MKDDYQSQLAKVAQKQMATLADYRRTFTSVPGRRVLLDLMRSAHMLGNTYVKGDSHETAFREGERNQVLRILAILKTDPEELKKAIEEEEKEYG